MPPSDLDRFLAEIFETLKKHEEMLVEFSASSLALQELLKSNPRLRAEFERVREELMNVLRAAAGPRLRSLDELIQQFRGTS